MRSTDAGKLASAVTKSDIGLVLDRNRFRRLRLEPDQGREGSAALEQGVVRSILDDSAVIEDDDPISMVKGGQAMGDGEGGSIPSQGVRGALDRSLAEWI